MQTDSLKNVSPTIGNTVLADVLPSTHEILTDMPMSPLYHTQCLWNPDNKGWIPIKLIHPMNDLDISFVKEGIVAFPKTLKCFVQ